jgi:hypothetical protein
VDNGFYVTSTFISVSSNSRIGFTSVQSGTESAPTYILVRSCTKFGGRVSVRSIRHGVKFHKFSKYVHRCFYIARSAFMCVSSNLRIEFVAVQSARGIDFSQFLKICLIRFDAKDSKCNSA